MSPLELADRIRAVDWSGCTLHQRLAVSAAVETLRKRDPTAEAILAAFARPMPPNLYQPERLTRLRRLDGTLAAVAYTTRAARWEWVLERVAELEGAAGDVALSEGVVTLAGVPVFLLA